MLSATYGWNQVKTASQNISSMSLSAQQVNILNFYDWQDKIHHGRHALTAMMDVQPVMR